MKLRTHLHAGSLRRFRVHLPGCDPILFWSESKDSAILEVLSKYRPQDSWRLCELYQGAKVDEWWFRGPQTPPEPNTGIYRSTLHPLCNAVAPVLE